MAENFNKEKTILVAFMDGSYKKIKVKLYEHKVWIQVTKPDDVVVYLNPNLVKYIEDVK